MVHNLDFTTGRAAFAYQGERAWHRLGQEVPEGADLNTWRIMAGLDFNVSKRPVVFAKSDGTMGETGRFALVRDDSESALGVASERYQPVQTQDVLEMFQRYIATDDRFRLETAGALKGGAVVWSLARFESDVTAGGDAHRAYLLLTTSFDGSLATTAKATVTRVVCNNTLSAALGDRDAQAKVSHATRWSADVVRRVHDQIEAQASAFDRFKGMADAMAQTRIAESVTRDIFKTLIIGKPVTDAELKEESGRARNQVQALIDACNATLREGTQGNTAWAALNAVTRYVDHERSTRVTSASLGDSADQARLYSSLYGSGASMKAKAVEIIGAAANQDFAAMLQAA